MIRGIHFQTTLFLATKQVSCLMELIIITPTVQVLCLIKLNRETETVPIIHSLLNECKLNPADCNLFITCYQVLMRQEDYTGALLCAQQSITAQSAYPQAWAQLASFYGTLAAKLSNHITEADKLSNHSTEADKLSNHITEELTPQHQDNEQNNNCNGQQQQSQSTTNIMSTNSEHSNRSCNTTQTIITKTRTV